jgi:hypothetical protein
MAHAKSAVTTYYDSFLSLSESAEFFHPANFKLSIEAHDEDEWEKLSLCSSEVSFEIMDDDSKGPTWKDILCAGLDAGGFEDSSGRGRARTLSSSSSASRGHIAAFAVEYGEGIWDGKHHGAVRVARDKSRKEKEKEALAVKRAAESEKRARAGSM